MGINLDDIGALLDDVLNDDTVPEESPTPAPLPDPDGLSTEDINTGLEVEALSPPEPEPEPEPVVDEIDRLIAEAAGEVVDEPEPEPDVTQCVTPSATPADTQLFAKGSGADAVPVPTFTDDDIMEQIDIRNFGTLVTLRTARWHAKIKDRKAAKDAADASGADAAAFEAQKHLLAGADEKLKRVHKSIDAARTAHYSMTLPWSVVGINEQGKRSGSRLLPNTLFMEYTSAVANAKQEMADALADFETAYPTLITIAQQKLGTAFNQTEYPPVASIGGHFGLDFDFMPIPKGTDFDGLQGQQAMKLAETLNKRTRTQLENAMQDAWVRLFETVQHAHGKLSNPDSLFHYTLVEKLKDQASMLKHLNVTGDARIEDIRDRIERKLTKYDVKDIRADDALRKRLAKHAGKIVKAMEAFANETQ